MIVFSFESKCICIFRKLIKTNVKIALKLLSSANQYVSFYCACDKLGTKRNLKSCKQLIKKSKNIKRIKENRKCVRHSKKRVMHNDTCLAKQLNYTYF